MESTQNSQDETIRIFSHKRVKIGEDILDMLHIEDIAKATKEKGSYKIKSGKYNGKYVKNLSTENIEEEDFCALPLTLVEMNLISNFEPDKEEFFTIENYKEKCPDYEYFIVVSIDGKPGIQLTIEEKLIREFEYAAVPSVNNDLLNAISSAKNGEPLKINANTINKMLGKEDSLNRQDPNTKIKSLHEYDLGGKLETLKRKIIGLDSELKILLTNITHNIALSYSPLEPDKVQQLKNTALIIGSRGTGKTFMIKSIAGLFGVPYRIEDSTRYTPVAYQGADIEDILINLYNVSGEEKEVFEHGIIFLDEFDKICKKNGTKDDSIKEDTQNCLLTIMQGTVITKKVRVGFSERTITLDTSKLTFVLSGAFEEILNKEEIPADKIKDILIEYGMIPQIADRVRTIIRTKDPTKENLRDALTEGEYSYFKLLKEYLNLYDINFEITEDFKEYIVDKAYQSKSGYRGLSNAINEAITDELFNIYSRKTDIVKLQRK